MGGGGEKSAVGFGERAKNREKSGDFAGFKERDAPKGGIGL
jgi:hypothetical protein